MVYYRYDQSPIWTIHRDYFLETGLKAWKREVPYTGISNFNEAYKKAQLLISNLKIFTPAGKIRVLEVGAGQGEFAKNFLYAFQSICDYENLDFYNRLKYYVSDFSDKTLTELKASTKFENFRDKIEFVVFDVLDSKPIGEGFLAIYANYLLDQLPCRIFAKDGEKYLEKYIAIEKIGQAIKIKKLKKYIEFKEVNLDKEVSLEHLEILEKCFRRDKASTVVYSYGAMKAIKNFLYNLDPNGILVCSDFNASTKPGIDKYEPCYYGNSLAQAVNFELVFKYYSHFSGFSNRGILDRHRIRVEGGQQITLVYEDPIKPLHTLIMTRPDFPHPLELGEIYEKVYEQNWFLRAFYRYVVELQLGFYIFVILMAAFLFFEFFLRPTLPFAMS